MKILATPASSEHDHLVGEPTPRRGLAKPMVRRTFVTRAMGGVLALMTLGCSWGGWELERAAAAEPESTERRATPSHPPLALHPRNSRYFVFRGQPTLLITSGEHYGAVLNLDFDYVRYLDELQADGLNHTRTWVGTYREVPGSFDIASNTLAPRPQRYICPWARSDQPGYRDGGAKFDLQRWDSAYFLRLRDFVAQASRRGIVVEMNLFCPNYEQAMWEASPMFATNNVQGLGNVPRDEVYTLKHADLVAVQVAVTQKVVTELAEFDNVYFEVCNEPYFGGVTMEWQHHIVETIQAAEKNLAQPHLISLNIANGRAKVENPHPGVSIFNFHYCHPPDVVALNGALQRPIGENETGFRGTADELYRSEAWDFLLAGGALYNNLDYSFTVDHPDGSLQNFKAPGGGGKALRRQLAILKKFLDSFDFLAMTPDSSVVKAGVPEKATVQALVEPGQQLALYVHGGTQCDLRVDWPSGDYHVQWIDPKTGPLGEAQPITHAGGELTLRSPHYQEDVAVGVRRVRP